MKQSFDFVKKDLKKLQKSYDLKLQEYFSTFHDPNFCAKGYILDRMEKHYEIYKDAYKITSNLLDDIEEKGVLRL